MSTIVFTISSAMVSTIMETMVSTTFVAYASATVARFLSAAIDMHSHRMGESDCTAIAFTILAVISSTTVCTFFTEIKSDWME